MPNYITKLTIPKKKPDYNLELKFKVGVNERRMHELRDEIYAYREAHPEMSGNDIINHFYQDIYDLIETAIGQAISHSTPPTRSWDETIDEVITHTAETLDDAIPDLGIYQSIPDNYINLICLRDGLHQLEGDMVGARVRVLNHNNRVFVIGERCAFPRDEVEFI